MNKRHTKERGTPEYDGAIRELGDWLLLFNEIRQLDGKPPQPFSTSLFHSESPAPTSGLGFYGRKWESMSQLYADLISLDGKYKIIPLQDMRKRVYQNHGYYSSEEDEIITNAILSLNFSNLASITEHLGMAVNEYRTTQGLEPRSTTSIQLRARRIWTGTGARLTLEGRSIHSSNFEKTSIEIVIQEAVKEQDLPKKHPQLLREPCEEEKEKSADIYFQFASKGHQYLVAYLLDPVNYHRIIGETAKLIDCDFSTENTSLDLFDACKEKLSQLEERTVAEAEVVQFTDRWLRCDLVYHLPTRGFIVVEVKQNAVDPDDKSQFQNAAKAREQLAGYSAALLERIITSNINRESQSNFGPLEEQVEGYLIAYVIDENTKRHLQRRGCRRAIEVKREEVFDYVKNLLEPKIGEL